MAKICILLSGRLGKAERQGDLSANQQLASVLSSLMGAGAIDWYLHPIPALNDKTPNEVMENEVHGIRVLRTLLMRMPI
jgi:hypothetical protein